MICEVVIYRRDGRATVARIDTRCGQVRVPVLEGWCHGEYGPESRWGMEIYSLSGETDAQGRPVYRCRVQ